MTDIKDVIHFYLGCEVEITMLGGQIIIGHLIGTVVDINGDVIYQLQTGPDKKANKIWSFDCKEFRICLKPLSSMTEEEAEESGLEMTWQATDGFTQDQSIDEAYRLFYVEQFLYLLKNHFDLWNLIESNQAIDKTKMK